LQEIKVIKTRDKFSLFGLACDDWIQCCPSGQLGLLTGMLLTKVAQELRRSVKDLTAFMETLKCLGVAFQSLEDGVDTATALGQFFFHVLGALAELERALLVERTQAGLAAARARGRVGGRPRKMTPERVRQAMGMMGVPGRNASAVARTLGITMAVLYRYVDAHGRLTPR
jgi:DNA invertase Pin-like site-specific DNA recombinase